MEEDFIEIYENYRKINMLGMLYEPSYDPVYISNNIVENLFKSNAENCVIRQYYVYEYSKSIYDKFIEIISEIQIKITTNINYKKYPENKYTNSTWYKSSYLIDNINFKKNDYVLNDYNYFLGGSIGIKNFSVKNSSNLGKNINKFTLPQLIYESAQESRKIYLQEINKYSKPICNITILRKNINLLSKENKLIMAIYNGICMKILNYFLNTMNDYMMTFYINFYDEFMIYNFGGLDYEICYYVNNIMNKIHPEIIFNNKKSEKYFEHIVRDMKEILLNLKYNSPYNTCLKYMSCLLNGNMFPHEKMDYLHNLTWSEFVLKAQECLKYSEEYYILTGIKKYGCDFDIDPHSKYSYEQDNYMIALVESMSMRTQKYLISNAENKNIQILLPKLTFKDYEIDSKNINSNEINNCVVKYWNINTIPINWNQNTYDVETVELIAKTRLVCSFVSEILNEPLFDKVRTIDKLGYIVKSDYGTYSDCENMYFVIFFLTQSSYTVKKISNSIDEFNEYVQNEINENHSNYLEKFRLLKKSKIIEYNKPFGDMGEEVNNYIESIITKNFDFDLNKLYVNICKKINWENDIEPIITYITNKNTKSYSMILNKIKK